MKKLLLIFASIILICGCSKDDMFIEDGIAFDKDGVSIWEETNFVFDRHYTLIDTISTIPTIVFLEVVVIHPDDNKATIEWFLNEKKIESDEEDDLAWYLANNKRKIKSQPQIKSYNFGDHIKAVISFENGKKVVREAIIGENKTENDIFFVNFGDSYDKVLRSEVARLGNPYYYTSDMIAMSGAVHLDGNSRANSIFAITLYTFDNGKLAEVGEYTNSAVEDYLTRLFTKFGFNNYPKLSSDKETLAEEYINENKHLTFEIRLRNDIPGMKFWEDDEDKGLCMGISFKKKQ